MHIKSCYKSFILVFVILGIIYLSGCQKPVKFQPRSLDSPKMVNCVSTSGHFEGNKPFIIGGNCYCNPTYKMYNVWQKEGYFKNKTFKEVKKMYTKKGYSLSDGNKRNNCYDEGKHAALGGKCLVPPTPGTKLYEKVVSGGKINNNE